MKQNVMPKTAKHEIQLEIDRLEKELRNLEASFNYTNNSSHFDIFIRTRANLSVKIDNCRKKMYLYYKTGNFNGDKVEALYGGGDYVV